MSDEYKPDQVVRVFAESGTIPLQKAIIPLQKAINEEIEIQRKAGYTLDIIEFSTLMQDFVFYCSALLVFTAFEIME